MNIFFSLILVLACNSKNSSDERLMPVGNLPSELGEISGMVSLGDDLYVGNNDSGNPAELYVFSLKDKMTTRIIRIKGASNIDWEELTADDQFVYISDTGNNSGKRKDLTIYRLKKDDLVKKEETDVEKITFYYPEQTKFKPSNDHNFDCEAMIVLGDSLYLFTKNRGDLNTDLYSIPKTPGNHPAKHLDQIDAGGLITGADFRKSGSNHELILIGYTVKEKGYHPFLLYFKNVIGTDFFDDSPQRFMFKGKLQTESVLFHDSSSVYITNEGEHGDKALIHQVILNN